MKIHEVLGPLARTWRIELTEDDLFPMTGGDIYSGFWRGMDKIAEHFKVPPFCPCGERPHRIHCQLGFDKYFPLAEKLGRDALQKETKGSSDAGS